VKHANKPCIQTTEPKKRKGGGFPAKKTHVSDTTVGTVRRRSKERASKGEETVPGERKKEQNVRKGDRQSKLDACLQENQERRGGKDRQGKSKKTSKRRTQGCFPYEPCSGRGKLGAVAR